MFREEKAPAEENDAINMGIFFPFGNPAWRNNRNPNDTKILVQTLKVGQRWPVVPDVLEQVEGFLKSVGLIVFPDHHVIAAARYHKDDGCHICITKSSLSNIWQKPTKTNHSVTGVTAGIYTDNLPLKHWIHFRRSSRWPPTSNILGQRKLN